jgi:hypothetical protein
MQHTNVVLYKKENKSKKKFTHLPLSVFFYIHFTDGSSIFYLYIIQFISVSTVFLEASLDPWVHSSRNLTNVVASIQRVLQDHFAVIKPPAKRRQPGEEEEVFFIFLNNIFKSLSLFLIYCWLPRKNCAHCPRSNCARSSAVAPPNNAV